MNFLKKRAMTLSTRKPTSPGPEGAPVLEEDAMFPDIPPVRRRFTDNGLSTTPPVPAPPSVPPPSSLLSTTPPSAVTKKRSASASPALGSAQPRSPPPPSPARPSPAKAAAAPPLGGAKPLDGYLHVSERDSKPQRLFFRVEGGGRLVAYRQPSRAEKRFEIDLACCAMPELRTDDKGDALLELAEQQDHRVLKLSADADKPHELRLWQLALSNLVVKSQYLAKSNHHVEVPVDPRLSAFLNHHSPADSRVLELDGHEVSHNAIFTLVAVLRYHPHLTTLSLQACRLTDGMVSALAEAAPHWRLTCLRLARNELTTESAPAIKAMLQSGTLHHLYLGHNPLGCDGLTVLAHTVSDNPRIATLSLPGCSVGDDGVGELVDALLTHAAARKFGRLLLQGNFIGDDGARALARLLPALPSLAVLNLAQNNISDEGAVALADAVRASPHVHDVQLSGNRIEARGCEALCSMLVDAKHVRRLDLSGNTVNTAALEQLGHVAASTPNLVVSKFKLRRR